ncbi:MAG: serine/threonine protein kinase [Thermoanaerobaculia bacterium]|nr:serine/threonine protein kinase [Thermoanaerobaculia bacterium]
MKMGEGDLTLHGLCARDLEPRVEIDDLLALEAGAGDLLAAPAQKLRLEEGEERIGPYRLLSVLGRGGMGIVYRASRDGSAEQQVALKVLRCELASKDTICRLEIERQTLARLEHPGIAQLLDGGSLPDGRPYLVLELVPGQNVAIYCANSSLAMRKRLGLFLQISKAVAFVHRHHIVHRDLKPTNILVTTDGVAKLLDFGIARTLDPKAEPDPPTASLRAPEAMTPRYASPEQIAGGPVTTASDVYALGLLLCEILTGTLPCGLKDCPPEDVPRRVCELEPEPLSQVALRTYGLPACADLDVIGEKAMKKDPAERYPSAGQLVRDVGRCMLRIPASSTT